jgi:hypothetical protein
MISRSAEHHPTGTTLKQSFVHLHYRPALIFLQKKITCKTFFKIKSQFEEVPNNGALKKQKYLRVNRPVNIHAV